MTHYANPQQQGMLDAILPHVAFDGWSEPSFQAAAADCRMTMPEARAICPRGAVDLAVLFHRNGDAAMAEALKAENLSDIRFRDRVARAVRLRLDVIPDREAVRRGTTLFALPHMAPEGSKLIWGTADAIWTALGDSSDDLNWYTKRATLSAVYGSVVLFWLGDMSEGEHATTDFIDRRIDNVMQVEQVKAAVNRNPLTRPLAAMFGQLTSRIRAPGAAPTDVPGRWDLPS